MAFYYCIFVPVQTASWLTRCFLFLFSKLHFGISRIEGFRQRGFCYLEKSNLTVPQKSMIKQVKADWETHTKRPSKENTLNNFYNPTSFKNMETVISSAGSMSGKALILWSFEVLEHRVVLVFFLSFIFFAFVILFYNWDSQKYWNPRTREGTIFRRAQHSSGFWVHVQGRRCNSMTNKMKYSLPDQCQVLLISFDFILIKVSKLLFKYHSYFSRYMTEVCNFPACRRCQDISTL